MAKTETKFIEALSLGEVIAETKKALAETPDPAKGSEWRVVQILGESHERKYVAILERDAKG